MKHNDIEEIEVKPSKTPDYQGALDRLKSIDLDYVSRKLKPEQLENVSGYSIHDYPNLEMMGDIETLQKLIDEYRHLEKTLDKACRIYDEDVHNCDFLLINNLCDTKCGYCDQEKRVELMKEWITKNVG